MKKVILGSLIIFTLLQQCTLAADILADDPAMIGTGARTLGLGRAFVAVADDVNTIFYNPAGLAQIDRFQAMSMSNSSLLLGELKYTTGAFVMPIGFGTIGMGVISKRIEDIPLLSATAVDSSGRPDPDQVAYGAYEENVTMLSYGIDIGTASNFVLLKNMALGFTLKTFKKYGRGENDLLDDASAQGYDLDLGMRSHINDDMSFGLAMRNVLDYQQGGGGGSLVWKTGEKEGIMAVYTAGVGFKMYDDQLIVAADVDVFEKGLRPSLGHAGVEWRVAKILALRVGWDQIESPRTNKSKCMVDNIMPLGIGITYFGFSADYAYYPAYNIEGNATHFFSISYLGSDQDEQKPVAPSPPTAAVVPSVGASIEPTVAPGEVIDLGSFPEQAVVYTGVIELQGRADGYASIEINGRSYPVQNGKVRAKIPLTYGRNDLAIKAGDRELKRQVLRLPTGEEMRSSSELADRLEFIVSMRDFASFYTPSQKLTRGQLASWIMAAKELRVPMELQDVFSANDLLVQKGYMEENAGNSGELITRGKLAVTILYLEGSQEALMNVPVEQQQAEAISLLDQADQYDRADFQPIDEIISLHDAVKLLVRTGVAQDKLKHLTMGFAVPYLEITPPVSAPGDMFSLSVKLPADVAVTQVTVQFGSSRLLTMEKLSERLYRGTVTIPQNKATGFYPVQVVARDIYGNTGIFRDYVQITGGVPHSTVVIAPVKGTYSTSTVLVNVFPKLIVPGKAVTLSVGLLGGQACDAVVLRFSNNDTVVFTLKDSNVFEGAYVWPAGMSAGTATGVFNFYSAGTLQGTMDYRFLQSGALPAFNASMSGTLAPIPVMTPSTVSPLGAGSLLTRVSTQMQGSMLRIHAAVGLVEAPERITAVMMILPDGSRAPLVKKASNVWTAEVFITPIKAGVYPVIFKAKDVQGKITTTTKKITIENASSDFSVNTTARIATVAPVIVPIIKPVVPVVLPAKVSTKNVAAVAVKPVTANIIVIKKPGMPIIPKAVVTNNVILQSKAPTIAAAKVMITGNAFDVVKKIVPTSNTLIKKPTVQKKALDYVPELAFNPPRLKKGQMVYASVVIPKTEKVSKVTLVLDGINNGLRLMNGEWQGSCKLPAASGIANAKIYIKYTDGHVLEDVKIMTIE